MMVTEPVIGGVIAAFVRASALAATAPVIGDAGIPVRARLVFAVAVGFAVGAGREVSPAELPPTILVELAAGIITGLTARFVLARVATAGQLMGLSLGLGFASQYDVHAGEAAGTLRSLLMVIAGLAFLAVGGLEAIVRSVAVPLTASSLLGIGPQLLHAGASAFERGLALAGPIVLAALVANIGLAVINRATPAMNVFSIALAAVLVAGGAVLLASAPALVAAVVGDARAAISSLP